VSTFMVTPVSLTGWQQMLLLLPLCLSVSIVYKTTKCAEPRQIPLATLASWLTIVVGMYAVGAALLVLYHLAS